jgi:hypothetical protein
MEFQSFHTALQRQRRQWAGQSGEVALRAALALIQTVIVTRINADKQG